MSGEVTAADPFVSAQVALQLLAISPQLGGICLRGDCPAREDLLDQVRRSLGERGAIRKLPPGIDSRRLHGELDLAASLAAGRPVMTRGLLEEAKDGLLIVPMAERMGPELAGQLAQALDRTRGAPVVVLLDDGSDADEHPPSTLLERVAFHVTLDRHGRAQALRPASREPLTLDMVEQLDRESLCDLAIAGRAIGVDSARALNFSVAAARAHAALCGRRSVSLEDLQLAAGLVLGPRATLPPDDLAESPLPSSPDDAPQDAEQSAANDQLPQRDVVLEATLAAVPDGLLDMTARRASRRLRGGGAGARTRTALRGRPLAARPGMPRGGARLALIDTLRAAVPWQAMRRAAAPDAPPGIQVRKNDLHVRRFEQRSVSLTIFCVDASGSAAVARLAEAKGAIERLLAQTYVTRSEVALIAFRGTGAELLLPPTRSLTRARRALAELPGGGGTPLASAVILARQLAAGAAVRGRAPMVVFLTDGSANIDRSGEPGRTNARIDVEAAARSMAAENIDSLVIDISPRPRVDARQFAVALGARYLALPVADAGSIDRAVRARRIVGR